MGRLDERVALIADRTIGGSALCRSLADVTDAWLQELFEAAMSSHRPKKAVALVAVGGYGRRELAPYSDLDVMLVHDGDKRAQQMAPDLWYPVWDAGLKLGHSVCTIAQALDLAKTDLDTATTLLSARLIAGDHGLADTLARQARDSWRKNAASRLPQVQEGVAQRHVSAGEVAFLLEPNLKEGQGGLRDIHAMTWTQAAGVRLGDADLASLSECNDTLLAARVALHRVSGRANDVLRLEDQDAVAAEVGVADADVLMSELASAARTVAWITGEVWGRVVAENSPQVVDEMVAPGVKIHRGEVHLDESADPATDRTLILRVATAAARHHARIDRVSLDRLAEASPVFTDPWPAGASDDLVALLLTGHAAIPVWESLDQRGLISRVLPEWEAVRSRPQRNAYHRFTVDRHLWEAAANAAELAYRVRRPDLLVLGALFHDIGKGYPGDHTDAGIELVEIIGPRLGLSPDDVDMLIALVRHHLLLPDVATRRDLSDPVTISTVAEAVGSPVALELLAALTEADSLATGPSAWSPWKAGLVRELVERTRASLGGATVSSASWHLFPSEVDLALMATGELHIRPEPDRVIVVSPDIPGTFSRVAGVLSLHALSVLGAQAHSDEQGMAASEFLVEQPSYGPIEWSPIVESLRRALTGQLAIEARLAERARTYRRRRRQSALTAGPPRVVIDNAAATHTTLIEVRAPDKMGILHLITKALAEVGLDIRHARVLTIDQEVVDTFYVRTAAGTKLLDDFHRAEVERAVLHAVGSTV
jgi:[protein-PII] uridylyltransferase